jgi:hypothetical protein
LLEKDFKRKKSEIESKTEDHSIGKSTIDTTEIEKKIIDFNNQADKLSN